MRTLRLFRPILLTVIAVALALSGCEDKEELARQQAAREAALASKIKAEFERKEQEKKEAERRKRDDVVNHPNHYLQTSGLKTFDKGFINSYRQLIAVTVKNTSDYRIGRLSGQVEWLNKNGGFVGASPLTLTGKIEAGESMTFTKKRGNLRSGTIQGKASKVKFKWNNVKIYN